MEIVTIAVSGLALIATGVGATLVVATRMPFDVLDRAQNHGRFAGLGSADRSGGPGRAVRERRAVAALPAAVPSAA